MKKNIFLFTAVILITGMTITGSLFAKGQQEGGVPSKLIYMTPSWGAPSEELLAKFKDETGIKVEVSTLSSKDLKNKVMTAAAGKVNPADVIFVGITDLGVFKSTGILRPLDGLVKDKVFNEIYGRDSFKIDGKTYCVPLYQQMVMIDYDKKTLGKAGLNGGDIKTWDDFENAALKIKKEGILKYPIAFGIRHWSWYLIALSSGSKLFDSDMNPTFDKPDSPGYKAYERLIGWYRKGLISPERLTSPNPHPSFWAGQAVFHQAWQGSLAISNNPKKSKIAPNAAYLLLPDKHYTWGLPAGLAVSSYTKYPKASLKFINFMISEETQKFMYTTNGMFPALKSLFKQLGDQGKIEGYKVMAEQAKYVTTLPYSTPWFSEFETELTNSLIRVARKEQTVDEAIKALAAYQKKLKKEYE
ncbi:MAG: extracellular solute-binding protein [Spirochaetes bacterium]|nr:extracellular solute-binding protein [Spirochaetota bacterium]